MAIGYVAGATSAADLTTYTFAAQPLGAAAADRYIVVGVQRRPAATVSAVTVGGVSATQVVTATNSDNAVSLWIAAVPTGTTGDVVVTLSTGVLRCAIQVYRLTGIASPVPYHTVTGSGTGTASGALNIPAGGVAIGCAVQGTTTTAATWAGLTEDYDAQVEVITASSASGTFASPQTGLTVSCTFGGGAAAIVAASWSPSAAVPSLTLITSWW